MPTNTADQGLTLPIDADTADNPVAFTNYTGGVENRLARRYTNEADRTARAGGVTENAVTALAAEDRVEVGDAANWVSLAKRAYYLYAVRTTDAAAINNSTALVSDGVMTATLRAASTFHFEGELVYSSSTTADIQIAALFPAGFSVARFNAFGADPGTTTSWKSASTTASATGLSFGGNGTGTVNSLRFSGFLTTVAAGTFAIQYAQNTLDATNTVVRASSYIKLALIQ